MKYFVYKENGEFNGFYDSEIHSEIPKESIKITKELWQELQKDNYKYKLNLSEDRILDIVDKNTYFQKVVVEITNIPVAPNPQELLAQQVMGLIIENKKKDLLITNLAKTIADMNIKNNQGGK